MTDPAETVDALWSVAFARCRMAGASPDDARDCAQDAIAELLARSDVNHPAGWVATVAYHRYIDVCRRRGRETTVGLAPAPRPRAADSAGPEEVAVGRLHARWLVDRMRRLPATTRAVCATVGAGMPRAEIGTRLGLTHRALESHLTRARRLLRALELLSIAVALGVIRTLRAAAPTAKPAANAALLPAVAALLVAGTMIGGPTPPANPDGPLRPLPATGPPNPPTLPPPSTPRPHPEPLRGAPGAARPCPADPAPAAAQLPGPKRSIKGDPGFPNCEADPAVPARQPRSARPFAPKQRSRPAAAHQRRPSVAEVGTGGAWASFASQHEPNDAHVSWSGSDNAHAASER